MFNNFGDFKYYFIFVMNGSNSGKQLENSLHPVETPSSKHILLTDPPACSIHGKLYSRLDYFFLDYQNILFISLIDYCLIASFPAQKRYITYF